jgi:tRNA(Ser,Leu) C12 N-acetylase TAN1
MIVDCDGGTSDANGIHKVTGLQDYNVLINVHEHRYQRACRLLEEFGEVRRTDFYNVLLLKVDSIKTFLQQLQTRIASEPVLQGCLSHVMPAFTTFIFQSPEEFEPKAKEAVMPWLQALAGKTFHVRMHRRGFKGRLSSQTEERFLDHYLMEQLARSGSGGQISFEDPDLIIAVETVSQWTGLSYWTREDLQRFPFLTLD